MHFIGLVCAIILDLLLGDPRWLPHPVRWIGSLIAELERHMFPVSRSARKEFIMGSMLCLLVIVVCAGLCGLILLFAQKVTIAAVVAVEIVLGFYCLSARSLVDEVNKVRKRLLVNDISGARTALSMIVGRDTHNLDKQDIVRAAVETVAESITDGIVSPLFYLALGGPVAAVVFKSVSTMDSMIGHKNDRYRHFGTFAARLDDVLNFVPARKTIDTLRTIPFRLLIVCNPNNPTGDYLPIYRIQELCEQFEHATICIDESYQEMGENCDSVIPLITRFRNLLVLKSLTKPFGIGGLRAGYAISSGGVLKRIRQNLMPWGVSSVAQRIIPSLVSNHKYFQQQWADILAKKQELIQALSNEGISVSSAKCPFFLVKTKNAEHARQRFLKEHHIALRSCASFGMPEWIRIMPGTPEQNVYLLDKFKILLNRM